MKREKHSGELGEVLSAYLDGELTPEEMEQAEALLRNDESARRLLSELQQTVQAVSKLPRKHAPASIAEEVQLRLERNELLDDLPAGPIRRPRSRLRWGGVLSMAAVLGVVMIAGLWTLTERATELPVVRETTLAQRSQEALPIEARRKPVESGETIAMARRSVARDPETPGALEARDIHDDQAARPSRATRGRHAMTRSDVASASKTPEASVHDKEHSAGESGRSDSGVMRLQLSVTSESARAALLSQLSERYSAYETTGTEPSNGVADSREPAQLVLRLPMAEVDELLSVADEVHDVHEMELTAGPLKVHGRYRVREVLTLALSPQTEDVAASDDASSTVDAMASPEVKAEPTRKHEWRSLVRSIGLDPDSLVLLLRPEHGETASAGATESGRDKVAEDSAPLAFQAQGEKTPEDSLVARRLRAAKRAEPESAAPPVVDPANATAAAVSIDLVIEISISEPAIQPGGEKPSYPTRTRTIKPSNTERNRPTAR